MDTHGLILSPGFPNNYSSGMHCVWQFFVPAGHRLTLEMFDFDVFESSERNSTTSADPIMSENGKGHFLSKGLSSKWKAQAADGVSERPSAPLLSDRAKEKAQNSMFPSSLEDTADRLLSPTTTTEEESESLQQAPDACPDDVLYITDLITFSSRFCGSQGPSEDRLVFSSDGEMVEVIMELITNTPWGRGFALIFRYHNLTTDAAMEVGGQRSSAPSVGAVEALLAAVSLAALFAMSLMIVLCVTLR